MSRKKLPRWATTTQRGRRGDDSGGGDGGDVDSDPCFFGDDGFPTSFIWEKQWADVEQ